MNSEKLGGETRKDARQRMDYIDSKRGEEAETSFTGGCGGLPEPPGKYDVRTVNASITRDKKDFLSQHLGVDIRSGDGPASRELIRDMKIVLGASGEPSGIEFEGVKVVVSMDRGKTFDYSNNQKNLDAVDRFEVLLEKAKNHRRTY